MSALIITKKQDWLHEVRLPNGKLLGTFEYSEDGYFYYCFPHMLIPGFLQPHTLREIADALDLLNKPWHDQVVSGMLNPLPQDPIHETS